MNQGPLKRKFGYTILIALLLILAREGIDELTGHELERQTYRILQWRLEQSANNGIRNATYGNKAPVIIIDIHDIEPTPWKDESNHWRHTTSRQSLAELLTQLADANASGIGIDIDFSPLNGEFIRPEDPAFFDFCKKLSSEKGIPIRLGVHRGRHDGREKWLNGIEYAELAASIGIPSNTRHLRRWIRRPGDTHVLPSLATALALSSDKYVQPENHWFSWLFQSEGPHPVGEHKQSEGAEFLANFGWLETLKHTFLRALPPTTPKDLTPGFEPPTLPREMPTRIDALRHLVEGRFVLLGDAQETEPLSIPGVEGSIPGIFLHASGIITLREGPLRELTQSARICADILFALLVACIVILICHRFEKIGEHPNVHRIYKLVTATAILAIWIIGYKMISITRVFWTDFAIAALALLLHPKTERWLNRCVHHTQRCLRAIHKFLIKPQS